MRPIFAWVLLQVPAVPFPILSHTLRSALLWLALLGTTAGLGQDTSLVKIWEFGVPVTAVAEDGEGKIWLSSAKGFMQWNGERFAMHDAFDTEAHYSDSRRLMQAEEWVLRYPDASPFVRHANWQRYFGDSRNYTAAQRNPSATFVCNGRDLLEFQTGSGPHRLAPYRGSSIRGFGWSEKGNFVVNSYDGVWINDTLQTASAFPTFNDGSVVFWDDSVVSSGLQVVLWPDGQIEAARTISPATAEQPNGRPVMRSCLVWQDQLWWYGDLGLGTYVDGSWATRMDQLDIQACVVTEGGLALLTESSGVWLFHRGHTEKLDLPELLDYRDLVIDESGVWYFATDRGLATWQPGESEVSLVGNAADWPSPSLCSIFIDDWGTLWISSYAGVVRFSPSSGILDHHYPKVEFNRFSKGISPEGALVFGSVDGLFSFHPDAPLPHAVRSRNVAWAWALGLGLVSAVLLILLARQRRHDAGSELMPHDAAEREQLLGQMLNAIHAHLATISVPFLADLMDLNERQLYRLCAKHALRPGTLIREIRLDRAQFLIRKEDCSVPDAAKQVGFTVRHLAKLLKEQAEAPPGATPDAAPRA